MPGRVKVDSSLCVFLIHVEGTANFQPTIPERIDGRMLRAWSSSRKTTWCYCHWMMVLKWTLQKPSCWGVSIPILYMYIYVYIYVYICICIYICIYVYIYISGRFTDLKKLKHWAMWAWFPMYKPSFQWVTSQREVILTHPDICNVSLSLCITVMIKIVIV